ncbi:VOC family protein [Sphingomonas sp.]|uniref:VOC family protein n=1 Tax=Sphingomonas sp. TaxID=28214 RepID=UPI001EBAC496|nr:VOC family protein [Sphingomonas sp.]MBX3593492.1 VOC family protein [Sphingomonas sp.]
MFTHIMVGASDVERSRAFYDATMGALGYDPAQAPAGAGRLFYGGFGTGALGVGHPANGAPASFANGGTIGLAAPDKDAVDAWHVAGIANGGTDEGAPGVRPNAPGRAYGAYLRDPDGNKLCAFCQLPA